MDTEKTKKLKEAETLVDFLKQLWTTKNNGQNARVIREVCFWIFVVCAILTNKVFPFPLPPGVYTVLSIAVYISGTLGGVSRLDRSNETNKIRILDILKTFLSSNQKSKKL